MDTAIIARRCCPPSFPILSVAQCAHEYRGKTKTSKVTVTVQAFAGLPEFEARNSGRLLEGVRPGCSAFCGDGPSYRYTS